MAKYLLQVVCLDCMCTYAVEMISAVETENGVDGYVGSSADFCENCDSSNVEHLGVTIEQAA